ncbi:hypothetical protein [uncultured Dokdonia sp.]|uniref:hypothetical protein n=1 Tax=uncultured Dokdonia sp. TaxID=575653 RepID=UPI00260655C9|nr:hypothetical protein [uncultured Dokdonia sp.]
MSTKTISFEDAVADTDLWQKLNPDHAKAFLIPTDDLLSALAEMDVITIDPTTGNITGNTAASNNQDVRAYMGIDTTIYANYGNGKDPKEFKANGYGEKLLIVGTMANPLVPSSDIDVMYDEKNRVTYPPGNRFNINGSGIYDFTRPCPNECDPTSPLYHK